MRLIYVFFLAIIVAIGFTFFSYVYLPSVYSLQESLRTVSTGIQKQTTKDCGNDIRISSCPLQTGDILLKRELTKNTFFVASFYNLYFTHSAIYLGDGLIIEAKGYDPDDSREIAIEPLLETDWTSSNMERWSVLRADTSHSILSDIKQVSYLYANSPTLRFGFGGKMRQQTSCAELVWSIYSDSGYSLGPSYSGMITPDYIYSMAVSDNKKLSVVYSN